MGKKATQGRPNHQLLLPRKERSWTQQEVPDRIGAPLALNFTRWERGTTFPSAHYVRKLCALFEKSASELGLVQDKDTSLNDHLNGYPVHESPERHHTLRQTITWSYHLLTSEEQRFFRQLSIFVGGCTLQAVEAVCDTPENEDQTGADMMTALLDRSLLQVIRREGEEPRFVMQEMISEYGQECLVGSGEMPVFRQAHAQYYLELAEEAESLLLTAEQEAWKKLLEREYNNLRTVLHWHLS